MQSCNAWLHPKDYSRSQHSVSITGEKTDMFRPDRVTGHSEPELDCLLYPGHDVTTVHHVVELLAALAPLPLHPLPNPPPPTYPTIDPPPPHPTPSTPHTHTLAWSSISDYLGHVEGYLVMEVRTGQWTIRLSRSCRMLPLVLEVRGGR